MGHGRLSASFCSPSFPDNQRLDLRYFSHSVEKTRSVSCPLEVCTNDFGLGVGSQVLQKIAGVQINAIAKADSFAVVDMAGYPDCHQFGGNAAALRDEAHGTAFTEYPHQEWNFVFRTIYTYAIWADNTNVSLSCLLKHLFF